MIVPGKVEKGKIREWKWGVLLILEFLLERQNNLNLNSTFADNSNLPSRSSLGNLESGWPSLGQLEKHSQKRGHGRWGFMGE